MPRPAPARSRRLVVGALATMCVPAALALGAAPVSAASPLTVRAAAVGSPVVVGFTTRTSRGTLAVSSIVVGNASQAALVARALDSTPGVTAANVAVPMRRLVAPSSDATSTTSAARQTRAGADPRLSSQWGLRVLSAAEDWRWTQGAGVTVAVVDDGVDRSHPDLTGMVYPGINIANPNRPADAGEHGTHVAGIIAARAGNGVGGAGLAPRVRILPVDVFDGDSTDDVTVAKGIIWAVGGHVSGRPDNTHPARVINLSLGGSEPSAVLRQATAYAQAHGAVVIAAAGNSGPDTMSYPAGYAGVIGVGAMDSDYTVADWSSTGSQVDVVAPGVSIVSTTCVTNAAAPASWRLSTTVVNETPNDCARSPLTRDYVATYEAMSGTSMATPFVSASAALLESRFPSWSAAQVATELQRTARDLGSPGRDDTYGRGLVQPVIDLRGAPSAPATVSVATTPDASSPTTTSRAVVTWSNVSYPGTYGVGAWRVQLSTDGGVHWSAIHTVSDSASRGFTFSNVPTALPVKARVAAVARLTGAVGPARDSSVVWSGADAGTTLDTATGPLTPGTSARDVIGNNSGPGADVDWFRITATTPSGSAPQPFTVGLGSAPTGSSLSIYAVRVVAGVPTVDATAITTVPGSQTVLVDPATITDTPDHYVAIVSGGNPGTAAYTLSVN